MDQIKELLPVISGLVALSVALVKVLEVLVSFLIKKLSKTKSEAEMIKDVQSFLLDKNSSTLSEQEKDMLKELYRVLTRCDEHGVPLCYYPRDLFENQKEIISVLNKISSYQEKTTLLLEYAIDKIAHIDEKHHDSKR